eukprot:scaffold4376_cov170-Skeletonema_marinoi.AAC.4
MSVTEYRELCRKVDEAMQLHKNSGGVVNVQTNVAGSPNSKANRASFPFSVTVLVGEQGMKPWCHRCGKMNVLWHRNRRSSFMR